MFGLYSTFQRDKDEVVQKPAILSGPNYYDNPEGTDPIGKLWGINKYAITSGLLVTSFDCLAVSNAQNLRQVLNIAGFWFPPLVGCATAFASVTYIANDVRKKDDKFNYLLGALACGPVLHAWRKNFEFTGWFTFIFMVSAWLKKESIEEGWTFFSDVQRKYVDYSEKYNKSIVTDEWPKRPY